MVYDVGRIPGGPVIPLGFEVGSGAPVGVPLRHLVVTGQTQESGKTTTLEALVARSGLRAIAFVTKRGEGSFAEGRRIQPYFRERADWQFVDQLLEAQLREKNKFLRAWIIRICRTTRTLAEVHQAVKKALVKARGLNEGVYTQLDAYLELIVPEIARVRLADGIDLQPGLNVMDVSGYATPMQMLFVRSALEWVNERERDVVTIIPEAWEFIPEGKGSPVKDAAVNLVRKGAGLRNYMWVDSQDTAGVDKVILRGCPVWLIGVQREANEIKRNLANIPGSLKRPTPTDVATLGRGQFFVCFADRTLKTYVQPAWMRADLAQAIARGVTPAEAAIPPRPPLPKEKTVTPEEAKELRQENEDLRRRVRELEVLVTTRGPATPPTNPLTPNAAPARVVPPAVTPASPVFAGDDEARYQAIKARLLEELPEEPRVLAVLTARPELRVEVERHVVRVDGTSLRGRIARLIADDFFGKARTSADVLEELLRRGADRPSNIELGNEMKALCDMGFFTRENKWYALVPGMKVNVVER